MTLFEHCYDVITMSAMMSAYSQCNEYSECIRLFYAVRNAKYDGVAVDIVCFIVALKAATNRNLSKDAMKIYKMLKGEQQSDYFLCDARIQTALIAMFGKFGHLEQAQIIFDDAIKDVPVCNAMIN